MKDNNEIKNDEHNTWIRNKEELLIQSEEKKECFVGKLINRYNLGNFNKWGVLQNTNGQDLLLRDNIEKHLLEQEIKQLADVNTVEYKRKKYNNILPNTVLRSITDTEIIIEFDCNRPQAEYYCKIIMPRLRANGYEFYLFDHKGRSPHIHIYNIPELKSLAPEYRRLYKRSFLEKYVGQKLVREKVVDSSLCNEGLIAMEFKPHWKHGTTKDLVLASLKYSDAGTNSTSLSSLHTNKFEHELFLKAVENYEQNKELNDKIEYKKGSGNWLCNWLLRQPRYLHQMDLIIFKNVAIALYNEDRDINSYCEALRIKDNKHHPESEIKSWFKWAKENNKKGFNKAEINQFFDLYPDLKR